MHIVVLNPADKDGWAQVFDTYARSEELDDFITKQIPEGHIIIAACKDECTTKLSQAGRRWFSDLGSTQISNLKYRQGFAFIGIIGREEANEKISTSTRTPASVAQVLQINPVVGIRQTNYADGQEDAVSGLKEEL